MRRLPQSDGCWIWVGSRNVKGYGQIQLGRRGLRPVLAHRASWEIHFGPIPDGQFVMHKCDNPPCVRPDHLRLGSAAENTRDMIAKGRAWFLNGSATGNEADAEFKDYGEF